MKNQSTERSEESHFARVNMIFYSAASTVQSLVKVMTNGMTTDSEVHLSSLMKYWPTFVATVTNVSLVISS